MSHCLLCARPFETQFDRRVCWTCAPTVPGARWVEAAYEAGRLAVVRADVDLAAWQFEREAVEAAGRAGRWRRAADAETDASEKDRCERCVRDALREHGFWLARQLDCRRWLEATR